jgi:sirohydrochlorin ferrochelatase
LEPLPAVPSAETLLLMVGRGSHDPDANGEMARFARLRAEKLPVGWLEVCFTAMAEPSLSRALELVAALPLARIVVQPHLLFRGELLERVRATVDNWGRQFPDREWIVTSHLGSHPLLCEAVLELASCDLINPVRTNALRNPHRRRRRRRWA